jgi:DNA-directed RNA polymerase subunit M/transcription elongation factor TFIIS
MSEKPSCPKCGSELTVQIANQQHCNSCGAEFAIERNPIARRAQAERFPSTGYRPHKHG